MEEEAKLPKVNALALCMFFTAVYLCFCPLRQESIGVGVGGNDGVGVGIPYDFPQNYIQCRICKSGDGRVVISPVKYADLLQRKNCLTSSLP